MRNSPPVRSLEAECALGKTGEQAECAQAECLGGRRGLEVGGEEEGARGFPGEGPWRGRGRERAARPGTRDGGGLAGRGTIPTLLPLPAFPPICPPAGPSPSQAPILPPAAPGGVTRRPSRRPNPLLNPRPRAPPADRPPLARGTALLRTGPVRPAGAGELRLDGAARDPDARGAPRRRRARPGALARARSTRSPLHT